MHSILHGPTPFRPLLGGIRVRKLQKRKPPKDEPNETFRRARGGVEKRCTREVSGVLIICLGIEPRQVTNARSFHRVFTGNDITSAQPTREVGVIIRMCGIHRHNPTIARPFSTPGLTRGTKIKPNHKQITTPPPLFFFQNKN